jgi:hypothetical protein
VQDSTEPIDRGQAARRSRGVRSAASLVLAVLAAATVVVGGSCLFVRAELLDSQAFADRTVAALGREPVRRVVARELTTQVIDRGSSDLLAARPLISSVVEAVVETAQFRSVIRLAADHGHRLLFDRSGNVAFSIADAGTVVISALRTLAPNVAGKIPKNVDATLLDLRRRSFAVKTLRAADTIRVLGIVLPLLALALLALAVAIAPARRRAITRCALALAVAGIAVFVDLALLRHAILVNLFGSGGLSNADVRSAAGALWDGYLGGLSQWALGLAVAGVIIAAASASVLPLRTAAADFGRLRARLRSQHGTRGRALRGGAALALGLLLLLAPSLAIDIAVVLAGALLLYLGSGELLALLAPPEGGRPTLAGSVPALGVAAAGLAVLIGGPAAALALSANPNATPRAASASTCNGYAQLCSRRLDQVVFPGTHNSMSAADSPGWFIANQRHAIARQLDDGIRAFKISTHYGTGKPGNVRTDVAADGARANRVSEKLTQQARAALHRFSKSVGFGPATGRREVWLCHTLCELGATNAVGFFASVRRFLQLNPGQVLIFFDEDYVSEASLEAVIKRAGLFSHLAVLREGQQLPTLGQLVRSQHNVLIFTQEPVSGRYPWDMYAFDGFIQDTPLGAVKPKQFTCGPSRGLPRSPLLMMNDWADVFPPRRSPNVALTQRGFVLHRARQCESERHRLPNLILTDFYESGDVVGAARALNGLGDAAPAPIVPLRQNG